MYARSGADSLRGPWWRVYVMAGHPDWVLHIYEGKHGAWKVLNRGYVRAEGSGTKDLSLFVRHFFKRNPGGVTFRSLPIGARFVFHSEIDPKYRFSGMARGPWVKTSARGYRAAESGHSLAGHKLRVGSINVKVALDG
jgi:hypothetical protein